MFNMEYRMYGLAIYQLHGKHMGIQFQHAVTRFSRTYQDRQEYIEWADVHQTSIVLQGGTTNLNPDRLGTINIHFKTLIESGIECVAFYEPDLGDQMTSFVFLVDERVFNKEKYPDLNADFLVENYDGIEDENLYMSRMTSDWIASVGGEKIVFLREYLKPLKLWA